MPESPITTAPPLPFDVEAARLLAASLDDLARDLAAVIRVDGERTHAAATDWRGHTRTWFDRHHGKARDELTAAAVRSAHAAEELRMAAAMAVVTQQRQAEEARRAAAAELSRMMALAGSPER